MSDLTDLRRQCAEAMGKQVYERHGKVFFQPSVTELGAKRDEFDPRKDDSQLVECQLFLMKKLVHNEKDDGSIWSFALAADFCKSQNGFGMNWREAIMRAVVAVGK